MMKNVNLKLPYMKNNTNFKIHNCAIAVALTLLMRKKIPFKIMDLKRSIKNLIFGEDSKK